MRQLFILAVLLVSSYFAQAQTRLVLYEDITDEGCLFAPPIDDSVDALMARGSNPGRVNMIKFMTDNIDGAPGPFFSLTPAIDSARQSYYSLYYTPFGLMDGVLVSPSALTQSAIDVEEAIPSPFKMSVSSVSAGDSITLTVKVNAVANYIHKEPSTIVLRTARCKTINLNSSPLWNGEDNLTNVVRDMYPSAAGLLINSSWHVGDSQTYVLKGPINREIDTGSYVGWYYDSYATDSFAVAWIQNDSDKSVAQSAKEGLIVTAPGPTGIKIVEAGGSLIVWPNPASSKAMCCINADIPGNASMFIFDATGRVCYQSDQYLDKGENPIPFDVADLRDGNYRIVLYTTNGTMTTSLSVINR